MPFTIACPSCGAKLKATETLVGKTIKCPRCSKPVLIQAPTAVATTPRLDPPGQRAEFADDERPDRREDAQEVEGEELEQAELDEAAAADDDDEEYDSEHRAKKGLNKRRPVGITEEERSMAMFIYLLALFTGFVGPLILWMMKREESRFIDFHGKQMVNFSITLALTALCVSVVGLPLSIITFGLGLLIYIPLMMAVIVYAHVMTIMGAVKANKGEWYEFPISLRLIK